MKLVLSGHQDRYPVEQLQLALFPQEAAGSQEAPGDGAISCLHRGRQWLTAITQITLNGQTHRGIRRLRAAEETVRLRRRILQQSYYLAALPFLPEPPPWGALAGVRPTKLTTRLLLEGGTPAQADRLLKNVYYVTPARRQLALDCSAASCRAAKKLEPEDLSLYVGVPFCPTRCAYCSFVSRSVGKRTELLEPYLDALLQEIAHTGKLLESSGRRVSTLYIGGGTPTTFSPRQLERLITGLNRAFDLSRCLEFTVEGGRPDTLDPEKLALLRSLGADRMSINPQTMEDGVLRACGRPHRGEDVIRAFRQAEAAGFKDVNMDLIAGLPTDTPAGFRRSLDAVAALGPANITVHTLALKKGADLFQRRELLPDPQAVADMVAYAAETLRGLGYRPYYLYRQKYMSGSFENVGWSREDRDCLYNIYMMEELHTIVSLGGGAVSKLLLPGEKLVRFANPKFPEQYLDQFPQVLAQKDRLFAQLGGKEPFLWTH